MDEQRLERLRRALGERTPRRIAREPGTREAAVLLVLRRDPDADLLLIERVERPGDPWSGHMALPGGRRDAADPDLVATAFRETEEEVGLRLDRELHLLGSLDEVAPRSQRLPPLVIAPFVAVADPGVVVRPDPREVAAAVWVPVEALRGEDAITEVLIELEKEHRSFPAYQYGGYGPIWGLTHWILRQFLEIAGG